MKLVLKLLIHVAAIMTTQAFSQQLSIDEAVRRASDRGSERERAQLAVAVAHQHYLESQSKFRLEFRPRIGLLSFSNPMLLASSLGAGLTIGRNQPPESIRQNGRIDSLAAEVAVERAVTTSRLEATRLYFDAMQREHLRDRLAQALKTHQATATLLDQRTRSSHVTILSRSTWELRSIALETELDQAEDMVSNARSALAAAIGMSHLADEIQLAHRGSADGVSEVPAEPVLRQAVFPKKDDMNPLRQKLDAEKKRIRGKESGRLSSLSLGYSRLNGHRQQTALLGQGGALMGSHTGTFDVGIKLPSRKTGEEEALKQYAAARLRSIELELDAVDDLLARELESMRAQLTSSRRKAEAAAKRLRVISEITRLIALREQTGLETAEAKINADADLARARYDLAQAQTEVELHRMQLNVVSELTGYTTSKGTMVSGIDTPNSRVLAITRPLP